MSTRNDKVWACTCGDSHFLRVTYYTDDPEGWVSVIDGTHWFSLWSRVKSAWKLIRTGAAPHYGCEVSLEADSVVEIIEALQDAQQKIGTPE